MAQAGLGYTGEWLDSYAQIQYTRARWYQPRVGRWTSPDPIIPDFQNPQSINRYAYVLGNPVNTVDPSGKVPTPPTLRPPDVCPSPEMISMFHRPDYILRRKDGSFAFYPSWDVDTWWYCGEFKVTAYQFVLESAYVNEDGTLMPPLTQGTTAQGTQFSTSGLFARDVEVNGTGRANVSQPCAGQGNYISSMVVQERQENLPVAFTCSCGSGRGITAGDAYKIVSADTDILRMGAPIYVPGLEEQGDKFDEDGNAWRGNADFVVRDTGQAIRGHRIDVFVGEGPGILAGDLNSVPSLQYTSYHHQRGVSYGSGALQPLAVYQKSNHKIYGCNWWY